MKVWIIGGLSLAACLAACSNHVIITAEKTGGTQGAGGSGSSGATGASGSGSSTGAGGSGPGFARVITAETDIGQYVSITANVDPSTYTKLLDGPLFISDVIGFVQLTTVNGGDCNVPQDKHTTVAQGNMIAELHGIRMPILAGQSLCLYGGGAVTVLGFKPY
jgi:uncharacterized spore protein YtfJ